ncbi:MAG: lysophospholipid acyltransferase family protein [Alphaproteobacteria bacterium]
MKRLFKKIVKSTFLQNVACAILAGYILLVRLTSRIEIRGKDIPQNLWDEGRPFILAFWHGQLLPMPFFWRTKKDIHLLISKHRDGQLIGKTVSHFGFKTVTGSSAKPHKKDKNKGGKEALLKMVRVLKKDGYIGMTPDGPRGPRMRASDGVAVLSAMTGAPVLPVAAIARKYRVFKSWDRFMLPLPFNKIVLSCGDALVFEKAAATDKKVARDAFRQEIEDTLNNLSTTLFKEFGHVVILPAKEGEK